MSANICMKRKTFRARTEGVSETGKVRSQDLHEIDVAFPSFLTYHKLDNRCVPVNDKDGDHVHAGFVHTDHLKEKGTRSL